MFYVKLIIITLSLLSTNTLCTEFKSLPETEILLDSSPELKSISQSPKGSKLIPKSITHKNLPFKTLHYAEDYRHYAKTSNSYSVKGWNHTGDALLFYRKGNLYQSKGSNSKYKKLIDFEDIEVKSSQKALVCGKPGYVFRDDTDNDEYSRVYITDGSEFKPKQLSVGEARNISLVVSNLKKQIAYASAEKGTGVWHLISQKTCDDSKPSILYSGKTPIHPKDFTPTDGSLLTIGHFADGFRLSEWNLSNGEEKTLLQTQMKINNALYSADGKDIYYLSNDESEFITLYRINRKSLSKERILPDLGYDIDLMVMSDDRSKMVVKLNQQGFSSLLIIDTLKLKLLNKPQKKLLGVISSLYFSPDGTKLAIRVSQPNLPPRSGVYDYKTEEFEPWTGGFIPHQKITEIKPQITSYSTFDHHNGKKRQIPLLIYKPSNASAEKPVPVVISAHGGPESQAKPSYSRLFHYYVSKLGVAVAIPNIRGSTGYGKSFELLDETIKREDAIKDIGALLDWIKTQAELNENKVAIVGGSYGGYVSLASLAAFPNRFRGGVSRVGITDFFSFMKNTEPYRLDNRRNEYGDERQPKIAKYFEQISPLKNASKIIQPVLIIQGARDPRVPQQQAEDMYTALKANGTDVSYLLAKDEGHKFSKARNKRMRDGAQIAFLKKVLFD